jgi:hypothetical protein
MLLGRFFFKMDLVSESSVLLDTMMASASVGSASSDLSSSLATFADDRRRGDCDLERREPLCEAFREREGLATVALSSLVPKLYQHALS